MKPTTRSMFFCSHCLLAAAALSTLAHATTFTWTKNSVATQTWTTAANWASSNVFVSDPTNELTFFSNITTALVNGTNTITTSVPAALSMNILTLNGKGADATATSTVNIASGSSTWTLGGTNPTVNLNGVNGVRLLSYDAKANLSLAQANTLFTGNGTAGFKFSGLISATSATNTITKTGTSTLTLTNTSNSFGGDVFVSGGVLDAHRGALGTTAGKTYVTSTGSTITGGQLSINSNGVFYNESENVVIQGTGTPANGSGNAALRFGGSAGSATTFCNMNGSITLDGNVNYKIDVWLNPTHWKINGGITRTGSNTGTLFLALSHYQLTNPVRLTINSTIDNNGGAVTLLGDSGGILQMDTAGHDIGAFTINGAYEVNGPSLPTPTQNYQTILKLGISNALATNQNLTVTKGTFDLGGYNQTVNALSGVASVSLITNTGSADSKLTVGNGGGGATFSGVIQDGTTNKLGLEKTGIGTQTLAGANTYTGNTTITGGTLTLSGSGSIASPNIIVGASTTFNVSTVTGGYTLTSAQTLSGTGTVLGSANIAGTLSPGNSPGILTVGSQTWLNGGDYNWQILDATGVAGTGFDTIAMTGTLDLSSVGLTAGGFAINLWSLSAIGPDMNGNATNFNNTLNQSWALLTASGGITGFDASDFVINTAANNGTGGFSNALGGGAFTLGTSGNTLVLNFTAVPEPASALLGGLGLLALLRRRR